MYIYIYIPIYYKFIVYNFGDFIIKPSLSRSVVVWHDSHGS
jgi:hypothetical protein